MHTATFTLLLTLMLIPVSAVSQIYKTTDDKGKAVFTDKPLPNAEPVTLEPPNTMPAVDVREPDSMPASDEPPTYQSLAISSPADQSIIANGLLPFTVSANLSPSLQPGHKLVLRIDGERYADSIGSAVPVSSIQRGQHSLELSVEDGEGNTLIRSKPVTVSAFRPSSKR